MKGESQKKLFFSSFFSLRFNFLSLESLFSLNSTIFNREYTQQIAAFQESYAYVQQFAFEKSNTKNLLFIPNVRHFEAI
jgi:hypothetical protein